MKRTPEARNVMRDLIHHALEHADMHARAMEEGHISDEHRAMCHAAALRALDTAAELHSAYRAVWLGSTLSQEIVDSADVGMEYAVPKMADGELRTRFVEVAAQVGSCRAVCVALCRVSWARLIPTASRSSCST